MRSLFCLKGGREPACAPEFALGTRINERIVSPSLPDLLERSFYKLAFNGSPPFISPYQGLSELTLKISMEEDGNSSFGFYPQRSRVIQAPRVIQVTGTRHCIRLVGIRLDCALFVYI